MALTGSSLSVARPGHGAARGHGPGRDHPTEFGVSRDYPRFKKQAVKMFHYQLRKVAMRIDSTLKFYFILSLDFFPLSNINIRKCIKGQIFKNKTDILIIKFWH